jgi:hypothetical protein
MSFRRKLLTLALPALLFAPSATLQAQPYPVQPYPGYPTTLWNWLGIPQGWHRLRDATANKHGRFPGLERKPKLLRIADPRLKEVNNAPIRKAQEIKEQEDLAPQKIKAIKYLADMGCGGCYPGVDEALLEALKDCTEKVRFAAVKAIGETGDQKCPHCNGSCCSEKITEELAKMAYERDDEHPECWYEPSERVREAAKKASQKCCKGGPLPVEEGTMGDPEPEPESRDPESPEPETDPTALYRMPIDGSRPTTLARPANSRRQVASAESMPAPVWVTDPAVAANRPAVEMVEEDSFDYDNAVYSPETVRRAIDSVRTDESSAVAENRPETLTDRARRPALEAPAVGAPVVASPAAIQLPSGLQMPAGLAPAVAPAYIESSDVINLRPVHDEQSYTPVKSAVLEMPSTLQPVSTAAVAVRPMVETPRVVEQPGEQAIERPAARVVSRQVAVEQTPVQSPRQAPRVARSSNGGPQGMVAGSSSAAGTVQLRFPSGAVPPVGSRVKVMHKFLLSEENMGELEIVAVGSSMATARPIGAQALDKIRPGDAVMLLPN